MTDPSPWSRRQLKAAHVGEDIEEIADIEKGWKDGFLDVAEEKKKIDYLIILVLT